MLLKIVMDVANFSPWVIGLMLSGALAAAMSTGANLAHTAAVVLTRDVLGTTVMRQASDAQAVNVTRWSVLGLSLVAYVIALFNPASLVLLLLGAYGLIVQLMPMVMGALFFPRLKRASVMAGAALGSLVFLFFQFLVDSPFGWHPGVWGLCLNLAAIAVWQSVSASTPQQDNATA